MDKEQEYVTFLRNRITQLRFEHDISEHRLSLELGKSGSYIRGITSGAALPSTRELFNIIRFFHLTPSEFFAGLEEDNCKYFEVTEKIRQLSEEDLEKVALFLTWIS